MTLFKILWGIDAFVAFLAVVFFFIGLGDGKVNGSNLLLWFGVLGVLAAMLFGSLWLKNHAWPVLAHLVLLLPALPMLGYMLVILVSIFTKNSRWN